MCLFHMFVTAVFFLFLRDLRLPKNEISLGKVSYPFSAFLFSYQLKKAHLLSSLESPARTSGNSPTHKRTGNTGSTQTAQESHSKYTVIWQLTEVSSVLLG